MDAAAIVDEDGLVFLIDAYRLMACPDNRGEAVVFERDESDRQLLVVGQSSSARPDGPSEGDLFRVTRVPSASGDGAHLDLIASQPTALSFLGWIG